MKRLLLFFFCFVNLLPVFAQRDYIKQVIGEWGNCRNVAISKYRGSVALSLNNAYACSGVPRGLANALKELHDEGEFIDDVQLTELGSWLILYGNNGFQWNDIPKSLENKMRSFNSNGEVITSVTFNDRGDWIIISTEHISSSSDNIYSYIKTCMEEYGALLAAHLTDTGLVLCFEEGFTFLGNVPVRLKNALKNADFDVYRIKFLDDGSYFFANKNGGRYEGYF